MILHHPYSVLCSWILVDFGGSSSEAWELKDVLLESMPDSAIAEEVLAKSAAGAVFPLTVQRFEELVVEGVNIGEVFLIFQSLGVGKGQ